jgi:3-hydroxybutyrate dehydrogenase
VLVTGAAGAIGAAFARAWANRHPDARFTLADLDLDGAARVAAALGHAAYAVRWDLGDVDSLAPALAAAVERVGEVDVLVSCAGVMEIRTLGATDWAMGARLLRIDLESPLRLMSLVVPGMRRRRAGTIVNVSSMAAVTPIRGCSFYGAAKAGLAMASEIARLELAGEGVHVVTVYPGPVRSELERRARGQVPATVVARLLPTGDPDALAERMVAACLRRRARVVYPAFYDVANRFPRIAGLATTVLSPEPFDV